MVARGDLGVEIPMETLANVQKDLVRRSNLAGKIDITSVFNNIERTLMYSE
jgi:pyruvate kinase